MQKMRGKPYSIDLDKRVKCLTCGRSDLQNKGAHKCKDGKYQNPKTFEPFLYIPNQLP